MRSEPPKVVTIQLSLQFVAVQQHLLQLLWRRAALLLQALADVCQGRNQPPVHASDQASAAHA